MKTSKENDTSVCHKNFGPKIERALEEAEKYNMLLLGNCNLELIPDVVFNMDFLKELVLSHNLLEELSSKICFLTDLKVLDLDHNYISFLPKEIGNLIKFFFFVFSISKL